MFKQKINSILKIIGLSILLISCGIFVNHKIKLRNSNFNLNQIEKEIERLLATPTTGFKEKSSYSKMPSINLSGNDFAGIIEIPEYGFKSPIYSKWESQNSLKRPAVYYGNPYTGPLIIGDLYSNGRLNFINHIAKETKINVTDVLSQMFSYKVSGICSVKNLNLESLLKEKYDLILFVKQPFFGYILAKCNISY